MAEDNDRRAGKIELGNGVAHRKLGKRCRRFGNRDRAPTLLLFRFFVRRFDHIIRGELLRLVGANRSAPVFQTALVTAQPFFDFDRGIVSGCDRILRDAMRFKHRSGIEMQYAIGAEAGAFTRDRHMAGRAVLKIFRKRFVQFFGDPRPQCFAYIDAFSRYAQH
jgi:hypothetical protein